MVFTACAHELHVQKVLEVKTAEVVGLSAHARDCEKELAKVKKQLGLARNTNEREKKLRSEYEDAQKSSVEREKKLKEETITAF